MNSEKWIHAEDCEIVRPDSTYDIRVHGHAVLMDTTEGSRVFIVPDSFTDEQIWECLRIANVAHECGYASGQRAKTLEIRKVLGLGLQF